MAGAHAEGLPGSRQAEAALLGQPLLTLTQLGGPQQHPTPGRPWHTLHWAGQALASCSSRGGRVPRALGPSRVRDSSPPLPENSESWPGARAAERADDGTRTSGHTGTQAWGTHDRAHSGLAAAPGQSGMWTVLCDKQAWEAARPRRGGVPQEGVGVCGRCWPHKAQIPADGKQTTAVARGSQGSGHLLPKDASQPSSGQSTE